MSKYYGRGSSYDVQAKYIDRDKNVWATDVCDYTSDCKEKMPGILRRVYRPGWGDQIYRYVQNKSNSAFAVGDVISFVAPVSIDNITSGTVSSITTSGLTANEYQYDILFCGDDAGAAGAAPEGEYSIILSNTTTVVYIDPDLPFTAAPAANDDFKVITYCHVTDAAAADTQQEFAGVAVSTIPDNYWGWVQAAGLCDNVTGTTTNAQTDLASCIAGTKVLAESSTSAVNLLIAAKRGASAADTVATKWMAELKGNTCGFGSNQFVTV